jgi:superfamily I DNA/RNA helicase
MGMGMGLATPEQLAVMNFIQSGPGNLLCNAVAGSGKTTTVVEGARRRLAFAPAERILLCAFNTRIKEALEEKLGSTPGLEIRTINSLGHRALQRIISSRLQPDARRMQINAKGIFPWGEQPDLKRLCSILKMAGWIPHTVPFKNTRPVPDTNALVDSVIDAFDLDIDVEKPGFYENLRLLFTQSIALAFSDGLIDYDDQIYLPVLWGAPFEKFPLVIVDEVQDINPLQRRLIQLCLAPGGRVVGVGDRNQAIYAFRGAGFASMNEFREQFQCSELPLTFCFRCPTSIITRAQRYVPQIQAPSGAREGLVEELNGLSSLSFLLPTDVVLCRNTKPLVALAYGLIRRGIPATILGREIGDGLLALVKKLAPRPEPLRPFAARLDKWAATQVKSFVEKGKENKMASLEDKVETLLCLIEAVNEEYGQFSDSDGPPTTTNLTQMISQMFAPHTDRLTLSTIHKAKGLEWDRVFFLDSHLIPSKYARSVEAIQQENNCIYVAVTRAQGSLYYINSEDFFHQLTQDKETL